MQTSFRLVLVLLRLALAQWPRRRVQRRRNTRSLNATRLRKKKHEDGAEMVHASLPAQRTDNLKSFVIGHAWRTATQNNFLITRCAISLKFFRYTENLNFIICRCIYSHKFSLSLFSTRLI